MKVIRLNDTAYDEDDLINFNIQFAIYHYTNEGYEGMGQCLAYKDKKWYTHDLGHCSCYGPFDRFNLSKPYDKLKRAIRDLHFNDWSNYYDLTIEKICDQVISSYITNTLFDNSENDTIFENYKNEI